MMTRFSLAHARALVLLMLAATVSCSDGPTDPPGPPTVTVRDNSFGPQILTVPAGTRVRWVNNGALVHDMTHNAGAFSSGDIAPGGSYERVVDATFDYACTQHAGMQGAIVVE